MIRNLLVCGLGLVLAGGLGLSTIRASVPVGTSAVGDQAAAQVYGGQPPPCAWWTYDPVNYACGIQAKPMPMGTWCQRFQIPLQNGAGPIWARYPSTVFCYECCFSCGGTPACFCPCSDPMPSTSTP